MNFRTIARSLEIIFSIILVSLRIYQHQQGCCPKILGSVIWIFFFHSIPIRASSIAKLTTSTSLLFAPIYIHLGLPPTSSLWFHNLKILRFLFRKFACVWLLESVQKIICWNTRKWQLSKSRHNGIYISNFFENMYIWLINTWIVVMHK